MTKNVETIAKALQELAQYEIDGSFIVGQAVDNVDNNVLRETLMKMKQEYENNIKVLSEMIVANGKEPPSHSKDFKGFFMQGYAAMRGLFSDEGVMKALHTNAQMGMKFFDKVLNSDDLPPDIKDKIKQGIYEVKKKHMEFIENQIK